MTFLWLAVMLYWRSVSIVPSEGYWTQKRQGTLLLIGSSICFGLAVLSNQRTLAFAPAFAVFGILKNTDLSLKKIGLIPKHLFKAGFFIFVIPFF